MLLSIVAVSMAGVLFGLLFRVPFLIAATLGTIVASVVVNGPDEFFERRILLSTLLLVVILQCAYLVGLFLAVLWRRTTTRQR